MGRIIVAANLSLDGVVDDPTGEEGTSHGGWFTRIDEVDRVALGQAQLDDALAADAVLFGRRTYDFFASRWPRRRGPLADRLTAIPKYVLSSTLDAPDWSHTTVLRGDAAERAAALKRDVDGGILVFGSFRLIEALVAADLVDELRLTVFPVVLGSGRRLFDSGLMRPLHLRGTHAVGEGLASLTYQCGAGDTGLR